jgi:hypothetical protein
MVMLVILFAVAGASTAWVLNLIRFNKKPCPGWLKWSMSVLFLILTIPLAIGASILAGMSTPNVLGAVMFVLMFHSVVNVDVKTPDGPVATSNKVQEKEDVVVASSTSSICPSCLSKQPSTANFCSSCGSKLNSVT